MAQSKKIVLVTGATGKQGGAVARRLLADGGFEVRAMTRKPQGEPAQTLARAGAVVVAGDLDDTASLKERLAGVWGVFAVQNTWEAGVEREEEQGKRLARLAKEAGVRHFVYSSVGSAHRKTGIPHFENKWRVEETVRGLDFPSHVIIRPVFFMENLVTPWFLQGDHLATALDPETRLQMVAVDDIGVLGARAFTHAAEMNRAEIDLAGDAVTMPKAAAILSELLARNIEFSRIPIEAVRQNSDDFALMLEWFDRVGYDADIEGVARTYGLKPTTLAAWARRNLIG
jgi:uncharacterized protein YbjT (DUF2867 family)